MHHIYNDLSRELTAKATRDTSAKNAVQELAVERERKKLYKEKSTVKLIDSIKKLK